jgi:hypothetical protein
MIANGFLPAGLAAALLVACSGLQTSGTRAQSAPPSSWQLALRVSGGIAGADRRLALASTGELTASDLRRNVTATRQLPVAAVAELDALVSGISSGDSVRNAQCRDCLLYRVEVQRTGKSIAAELDDTTIAGTRFEPLVRKLIALLTEALSK